jgi:DnaK suppressor protein
LNAELDAIHTGADTVEASGDDEFGEGAATPVDRDRLRALVAAAHHHLDEIDRALRRLDAGTYGTCEVCGQSIDPARLDALPAATLCVGCKAGGLSTRRPGPGRTRAA